MPTTVGYFTDLHARYDTPEGRTDDFRISMLAKLEEIGEIWKSHGVQLVLFGGDLFHTPDPARSMEHDVMHILKSWQLPIVAVVGSHDYFGYQIKTLKRTSVGIFEKAGILQLVDSTHGYGLNNVWVCGTPHSYTLLDDLKNFYVPRHSPVMFQIQLVHGDIVHAPVPWPHVTIAQVKTESDLVLCGHVHSGWSSPHSSLVNGHRITFINPGSIGRLENTGVERIPRVCIFEVADNMTFKTEYVQLAKALKHPFRIHERQPEESTIPDISRLFHLIETTEVDVVDVKKQLPIVAREAGFSEQVVSKAFEFLEEQT